MHGAILQFLCPYLPHPIHLHVLAARSQKPNLFTSLRIHMNHLSLVHYYLPCERQPPCAKWSLFPLLPLHPQPQQCTWSDLSEIQTSSSGPQNKNQILYHSLQAFHHLASNYSLFSSFFSLSLTVYTLATLAFSLFFQLSKACSHLGVWVCLLLCRVSDSHSISNFFSFSSWRTSLPHLNAPSLTTMLKSVPPFVLLLHIAYHYWQLSCLFKKKIIISILLLEGKSMTPGTLLPCLTW